MSEHTTENDAPACECPTDDYCPKCHPRWHAKWMTHPAESDAASDQPPGFPGDDNPWLPPADEAAERVLAFVSWFGDGEVYGWTAPDPADTHPSLFTRDLEAVAKAARTRVTPPVNGGAA